MQMQSISLDLAVSPLEANQLAAQAASVWPEVTYDVVEHGPGGGNPCATFSCTDQGALLAIAAELYGEGDYAWMIN